MEGEGFEPPNPKERIYSPPRLASSLPFLILNWYGARRNRTADIPLMKRKHKHLFPQIIGFNQFFHGIFKFFIKTINIFIFYDSKLPV